MPIADETNGSAILFDPGDLLLYRRCKRQFGDSVARHTEGDRPAEDATRTYAKREADRVRAVARLYFDAETEIDAALPLSERHERTLVALQGERSIANGTLILGSLMTVIDHARWNRRLEGWEVRTFRASTGVPGVAYEEGAIALAIMRAHDVAVAEYHVTYLDKTARVGSGSPFRESNIVRRLEKKVVGANELMREFESYVAEGDFSVSDEYRCGGRCSSCHPITDRGPFSVFTLHKGRDIAKELSRTGVTDLRHVDIESVELSKAQKIQVAVAKGGHTHIDCDAFLRFESSIEYPLFFLDFEAISPSLPYVEAQGPFEHVPVIASLHKCCEAYEVCAAATYTSKPGVDERDKLLDELESFLEGNGSIVVFNRDFERAMLTQLGRASRREREAQALCERLVDLHVPFKNFTVYHRDQAGKTGLKKVLSALTTSVYDDLDVQDGMVANLAYTHFADQSLSQQSGELAIGARAALAAEPADLRIPSLEAVNRYCAMDTLAMVQLLSELHCLYRQQCPENAATTERTSS